MTNGLCELHVRHTLADFDQLLLYTNISTILIDQSISDIPEVVRFICLTENILKTGVIIFCTENSLCDTYLNSFSNVRILPFPCKKEMLLNLYRVALSHPFFRSLLLLKTPVLFPRVKLPQQTSDVNMKTCPMLICSESSIEYAPETEQLLGFSSLILQVRERISLVADKAVPVLLLGESGTGKTYAASIIHNISSRRDKIMCSVNMADIPVSLAESELFGTVTGAFTGAIPRKGYFPFAAGGTLFLDEIGELSLEMQSKLLRVIETKRFRRVGSSEEEESDVRLIFATNADLKQLVIERKFRQDLFYRVNVFPLYIPPLRDRKQDIPCIAESIAKEFGKLISIEAMKKLCLYHWPGNIRELRNCINRACIMQQSVLIQADNIIFL